MNINMPSMSSSPGFSDLVQEGMMLQQRLPKIAQPASKATRAAHKNKVENITPIARPKVAVAWRKPDCFRSAIITSAIAVWMWNSA